MVAGDDERRRREVLEPLVPEPEEERQQALEQRDDDAVERRRMVWVRMQQWIGRPRRFRRPDRSPVLTTGLELWRGCGMVEDPAQPLERCAPAAWRTPGQRLGSARRRGTG